MPETHGRGEHFHLQAAVQRAARHLLPDAARRGVRGDGRGRYAGRGGWEQGSNLRWEIHVKPASKADVDGGAAGDRGL